MPLEEWMKLWMYMQLGCLIILPSPAGTARPRFDTSTDMGLVLVPADAEIDSVIFRLRATDQDADFPLVFDITATVTPIVRIENLPCTLYNKVCQANVVLTKRLVPGRLHDFAVRVKDSKGDSNSMQATISVTNATTQRDKIFPHIPAIIMVPEDTKPGKELDYVLVRSNQWSGKPVYIELWQPKELFTIRQRQTPAETRGVITLIGELDFETQSMYTLKMYATDPYTEPKKDTRNIAGLHLVVIVQDVQDVPPIFTLAPPLTKINNTIQPGDFILRVHAEDGDKGVPREVTYGLVSEGNPFTPFFNISETTGEIILARPLEELTFITHVGAPVVLSVVAEEIRRSTSEPPAQATVVEVGLLLGEPGNSPPFFENDKYVAWMDENAEPGTVVNFTEHYITKVRDEDIGKAGVFALKLYNNNGTFEISPAVAERMANFIITVRDNSLIDYEMHKSLRFEIIAQEVGPATNLSANVLCTIFIRDVNDNAPEFDSPMYEVTLSEDVPAGTRVVQVHAIDKDTGSFGRIQYTRILGPGNEAFMIDPNTGIITVAIGDMILDRETTATLELSVEGRDEDGKGLRGTVPLIINLLDVNDNAPIFEKETYEFTLNEDLTNFTMPALIKAFDGDAEPPNNEVRYEIIHGNYENKFHLDEMTGELFLREPINKARRTRHNSHETFASKVRNDFSSVRTLFEKTAPAPELGPEVNISSVNSTSDHGNKMINSTSDTEAESIREKRDNNDVLFTLTARAYDLGVPHMSGVTRVNVMKGPVADARLVSFVVPGENPDPAKTAETLAAITGGHVSVQEIRPYTIKDVPTGSGTDVPSLEGGKKSIVVARVEPNKDGTSLVDIDRIRAALAANGVGVISGDMTGMGTKGETKSNDGTITNHNTNTNTNITTVHSEEVTVYRAENRLLFWLLIILGLLMLAALIALIICCICPGCPFYMAPRKRRVHSSETLIPRSDGRPKRHLHRSWPERKQAWSADPMRRNWQFNRRNQKAGGLASLPGDVHAIDREQDILEKAASLRLRDGPVMYPTVDQRKRPEDERIYIEDVEGIRARGYMGMDSFRNHDPERGLEMPQQVYINQEPERIQVQPKFIREQHFYRDGNAEVLRLVTRGQIEEAMLGQVGKRPQTLVIEQGQLGAYRNDGKEILLQRFIEDQTNRQATNEQELHDSFQDIERRSMESHQRQKEAIFAEASRQQPKIVLLPERLEEDHRQHFEELGPEVQRLIIDHSSFEKNTFESKDNQELAQGPSLTVNAPVSEAQSEKPEEQTTKPSIDYQHYLLHDLELARQNALLTKLLLARDSRDVGGGALVDSASYLETQSLPGQVAIATQTDRTAATQTEMPNRSRSDNDESEEEARIRKKLKSKKRYAEPEPRRIRTLWIKSPIEEEEMQYGSEKKTIFLRKKMRDVKDSRRICLEPDVLREISDSLDENGESPITARKRGKQDSNSDETRVDIDNEKLQESSSMEMEPQHKKELILEKGEAKGAVDEGSKKKNHRGMRENIVEPSFRILEKEMNSLSKKLSRLTGKKLLNYSNGSETDCQEQVKPKASTTGKKIDKKTEIDNTKKVIQGADVSKKKRSKSTQRTVISETPSTLERIDVLEECTEGKTRQTTKSRKGQNISTGSSDFEETMEKLKKSVPQVLQMERQRQTPAKSSYSKLKRYSRVEPKDLAKSTLSTFPQETEERRDASDTGSKGSIKSYKNEKNSMRMKRYSTEPVEGHSGLASSSASSDSFKDKRGYKKDKTMIDKMSVPEVQDGKTQMEHSSGSFSSDNVKDKKLRVKEKSILHQKSPVDIVDSKTNSEHTAKSPNFDNARQRTPQMKQRPVLDRTHAVEVDEGKVQIREIQDSPIPSIVKDQEFQSKEDFTSDKTDVAAIERKTDYSGQASEASHSEALKDIPEQKEVAVILDQVIGVNDGIAELELEIHGTEPTGNDSKMRTPDEKQEHTSNTERIVETISESDLLDRHTVKTSELETQNEALPKRSPPANSQDTILKKNETQLSDQKISGDDSEPSEKVPQGNISTEFPGKSVEEIPREKSAIEILRKSPEAQELTEKIIPVMEDVQTGKNSTDQREGVSNETIIGGESGELEQDSSETRTQVEGIKSPEQEMVDFMNHETQHSMLASQAHYQTITEGAEKIADIVLDSVVKENTDGVRSDAADKESEHKGIGSECVDNIQTGHEDMKEIRGTNNKMEKKQSEDGAAFSDNFDSFCGTDGLSKTSRPAQKSDDEIPYELLHSEPSEQEVPNADPQNMKEGMIGVEQGHRGEEQMEKGAAPQILTVTETHESQEISSLMPVADPSASGSPTIIVSCSSTPVSPELKQGTLLATNTKATPVVSGDESEAKLKMSDAPKGTEPTKLSKTEEFGIQSVEEHEHQVPIVPPLEIELLDETFPTSEELHGATPKSPTFPVQSPDKLPIEIPSQKEFGIADALFLDARIVSVPSSPHKNEDETKPETLSQEMKQETAIPVPPINLDELSRAMLEDADDSDSSDASSKTMLTARPYGTPRHRPISGSKDVEAGEVAAVSLSSKTDQDASKVSDSPTGPGTVNKEESPDDQADQILKKEQSPAIFKLATTERVPKEESAAKEESSFLILHPDSMSEATTKVPESDEPIHDQISETAARQEDTKIKTTEKVQLSQIQQNNLPADPDGFASLPETGSPVKSIADTTLLHQTTLSEGMKEVPEELTEKDPENHDDKTFDADRFSFPSKTFVSTAPTPTTELVTEETEKSEDSPPSGKTSLSKESKKLPMKLPIDKKPVREWNKKAKIEGPARKGKKDIKEAAASNADLLEGPKKRITPATKTGPLKKERPVKTLKDESDKLAKQTAVIGQLARSRDPKRQVRPVEEETADRSNWLSKPDRMRRTWKTTEHSQKDAVQSQATKTKIVATKETDKSVGKKTTETSIKQQKGKGVRLKNIRGKDKKLGDSKILPEHEVEKGEEVGNVDRPGVVEDTELKEAGVIGTGQNILPAKEKIETQKTIQPEKLRASNPILEIQKLIEDDNKEEEKKLSEVSTPFAKSPEPSKDVRLVSEVSEEQPTGAGTTAEIFKDTGTRDSVMSNDQGSTVVRGTNEKIETTAAIETIGPTTENSSEADQEKEKEKSHRQSEKTSLPHQKAGTSETEHAIEKDETPSPHKIRKFQKEIGMNPEVEHAMPEEANDSRPADPIQQKLSQASMGIEETPQKTQKSPKNKETDPVMRKAMTEAASASKTGDAIEKNLPEAADPSSETSSPQKTEKSTNDMDPNLEIPKVLIQGSDNSKFTGSIGEKALMTTTPQDKSSSPLKAQKLERELETDEQLEAKKAQSQKVTSGKPEDSEKEKSLQPAVLLQKTPSPRKAAKTRRETESTVIESQSRYMEWYKLTREEMERKRQDRKDGEEEEVRPKWLRKRTRQRWIKVGPEDKRIFDPQLSELTPSRRKKIKPLVNVESEQLKAIVRQGRKLRKARGESAEEPQILIFAPDTPPPPLSSICTSSRSNHHHHLIQHSEYKYEKMPLTPFYLHPQPPADVASQIMPQSFDDLCHEDKYSSLPTDSRCPNEIYDSGVAHQSLQGGNKLRHGELLEKKSVFDIAYSEAAPSQLRSDSTTPPS